MVRIRSLVKCVVSRRSEVYVRNLMLWVSSILPGGGLWDKDMATDGKGFGVLGVFLNKKSGSVCNQMQGPLLVMLQMAILAGKTERERERERERNEDREWD